MSVTPGDCTITDVDQTDVLFRSLAIAVVIVAPYAIYKVKQVRRTNRLAEQFQDHRAKSERRAEAPHGHIPALEDVIADISFVEAEANRNGGALLVVPHSVTVSDRPAPPELVDTLVRDALRRSNLLITAEADSVEGRLLECAPATPGANHGAQQVDRGDDQMAELGMAQSRMTESEER